MSVPLLKSVPGGPKSIVDDLALVRQLLDGDPDAFNFFFDHYYRRLLRFALPRLTMDTYAAEEVSQITLTRAMEKLGSFRGEARLMTWLCAICRREITEWIKQQCPYPVSLALDEGDDLLSATLSHLSTTSKNPDTALERQEINRHILDVMDQLKEKYRNILFMKYVNDYSITEIANNLGLSNKATESLLNRAREKFRLLYERLSRDKFTLKSSLS